jgi:hypothetical protein
MRFVVPFSPLSSSLRLVCCDRGETVLTVLAFLAYQTVQGPRRRPGREEASGSGHPDQDAEHQGQLAPCFLVCLIRSETLTVSPTLLSASEQMGS